MINTKKSKNKTEKNYFLKNSNFYKIKFKQLIFIFINFLT